MILALLMVACLGPLPDPLAEQRASLAALPPPSAGWPAQASLEVGRESLEDAVGRTVDALLTRGLAPSSLTVLGLTATVAPEAKVSDVTLVASPACADCLGLDVKIGGAVKVRMGNATGSRELSMGFHSALSGVMALSYDGDRVLARPGAPDRWSASLSWDELPTGLNQTISALFTDTLRRQLALTDLPPLPVVRLRGETPVPVTGLRLRSTPSAIALDLAFAIPTSGVVDRAADPQSGWVLTVPQETALGLMQALSLAEAYDPNARATPELMALRVADGGFELDVRAWPTRGRNRPRDLTVSGAFGLEGPGDLFLRAESARWLRTKGEPPDLAALLFGDRLMDGLVAAMAANLPGTREQSFAGMDLLAETTRFSAADGDLRVEGTLSLTPSTETTP